MTRVHFLCARDSCKLIMAEIVENIGISRLRNVFPTFNCSYDCCRSHKNRFYFVNSKCHLYLSCYALFSSITFVYRFPFLDLSWILMLNRILSLYSFFSISFICLSFLNFFVALLLFVDEMCYSTGNQRRNVAFAKMAKY